MINENNYDIDRIGDGPLALALDPVSIRIQQRLPHPSSIDTADVPATPATATAKLFCISHTVKQSALSNEQKWCYFATIITADLLSRIISDVPSHLKDALS